VDFSKLASNLGLDEDEFRELVELFVETSNADINRLENAYHKKDHNEVSEAAHSLKGSSGNLGFMEFSAVAREAERSAAGNLALHGQYIAELRQKLNAIHAALSA
jgi:histidine phosphotransfer protein HptB